jgi:tRNA-modifying protein YgfZ
MASTYPAALVSIEGPDALAFAQAQFSSNVALLADGRWQFSAWLDAQGRVRALFHLLRLDQQRLRLLLRGGDAEALASQLHRYLFRTKARIAPLPIQQLATREPLPLHAAEERAGELLLGCDSHSLVVTAQGDDDWRLPQLRAAWPWLPEQLGGQLLAAALGLDSLAATALDKGCYPGQEIVARLHYRGGHKRHLHHVRLSRPLPAGSALQVTGPGAVQLLDVMPTAAGAEALAIVHDDLAAQLDTGLDVTHDGLPVRIERVAPSPSERPRPVGALPLG